MLSVFIPWSIEKLVKAKKQHKCENHFIFIVQVLYLVTCPCNMELYHQHTLSIMIYSLN